MNKNSNPKKSLFPLAGMILGASLMYFLDPRRGASRRHYIRDKTLGTIRRFGARSGKFARYASGCLKGWGVKSIKALTPDRPAPDSVLAERVRSKAGHLVSQPRNLQVTVENGHVVLAGSIPQHEIKSLLSEISALEGVRGVDNHIQTSEF